MAVAEHHNIPVVEDNAHSRFGRYKGTSLGTFGSLATQSFHETKNFQCGEGGALLINDPQHIERAEIIREKGTNRSRFFRGQIDKYTWVDVGILAVFHYLPLHLSDVGKRLGGQPGDCPVTEDVSDRLLRLPFYNGLSQEDQAAVIEALHGFTDF